MTDGLATLVSFAIYLAFFGWLGWRRGVRRELIVFAVALLAWVLFQERGDVVVEIANVFVRLVNAARGGTSSGEIVTSDTRDAFLFVIWAFILVAAYALTYTRIPDKDSPKNGWAIFLGMINGLFFAVAFLPSLSRMLAPDGTLPEIGGDTGVLSILGGGLSLLWDGVTSLWGVVEPMGSLALLVLLTLILVLAATSIRGSKAKS